MAWPSTNDYHEAIQDLAHSLEDEELQAGKLAQNRLGLPLVWSGGSADVYRVHCPQTGRTWAVKCFTRETLGLRDRYREIDAHLHRVALPFIVNFQYLERGIEIKGGWFPVLKMRWTDGKVLDKFVEDNLEQPRMLKQLLRVWMKLAGRLREADVAHADLQHGNVILIPWPSGQLSLRLIDYDGMHVPKLAGLRSAEVGHPAYQHPQRLREGTYCAEVDGFSHLVICCAICCLAKGQRALWDRFSNGDNLLFRESDFRDPASSELFRTLWKYFQDTTSRSLVGHLALACQRPIEELPPIEKILVDEETIRPLTQGEEARITQLLDSNGPSRATPLPSVKVTQRAEQPPTETPLDIPLLPTPWRIRPFSRKPCPSCGALLPDTGNVPFDEVRIDSSGNLVSQALTIQHKAGFWTEINIKPQSLPWEGSQPEPSLSRIGAGITTAVVGFAPVVTLAALGFLIGLPVRSALALLSLLACMAMAIVLRIYQPKLLTSLDYAWQFVVPDLLDAGLSPPVIAFLGGLARASHTSGEPGRRKASLKRTTEMLRKSVNSGLLPSSYLGELLQLEFRDHLRTSRRTASNMMCALFSECIAGTLPAACLDHACYDGRCLDDLEPRDLAALPYLICQACHKAGGAASDVMLLQASSKTANRVFAKVSNESLAKWHAVLTVLPNGWKRRHGATVFEVAQRRDTNTLHRYPSLLAIEYTQDIKVFESGVRFRGKLYRVNPSLSIDETRRFVQTGWTHQRRDGGRDRRYRNNPPRGYWKVTGYQLKVGSDVFTYTQHPREIIGQLRYCCELLFETLQPRASAMAQQPSGRKMYESVTCPECGARDTLER